MVKELTAGHAKDQVAKRAAIAVDALLIASLGRQHHHRPVLAAQQSLGGGDHAGAPQGYKQEWIRLAQIVPVPRPARRPQRLHPQIAMQQARRHLLQYRCHHRRQLGA